MQHPQAIQKPTRRFQRYIACISLKWNYNLNNTMKHTQFRVWHIIFIPNVMPNKYPDIIIGYTEKKVCALINLFMHKFLRYWDTICFCAQET